MERKYTPGPWEYDGNGRIDAVQFRKPTGYICDDGSEYIGGLVALPYHCGVLGRGDTREANARLIAAAPELFEALQELADLMQGVIDGDYMPDSFTLQPGRSAIAKALGGVEQAEQDKEAA